MLSFAKSSDDTNNSQFFITDGPTRHLDFNHSVFGVLTEGDKVREAINDIANPADRGTNANNKPLIDIVLESVTVFNDTENSVVMFKAKGNQTGTTNVTITATNASGETFTQVVPVSVVADTVSGGNSQPFLHDIPTPAPFPNTAPATLQLASTDVEGDAVQYFVSTSNTNVTATVDATTGLVTVTPGAGFVGNANVLVGVRPAPGVVGQLADQFDTQLVTFAFTNSEALAAPAGLTLASDSDTGASNSDGITRSGSLVFTVSGVQSGAEVILYAGTTEVGRGLASGTTATITTSNIAALGDGNYQITARQTHNGQTSGASPAFSLTYDATQPIRIQNFPTNANVGVALSVNLSHPEEGPGLVYGLTGAPTGLTINPSTGVLSWTPTASQIGNHTVTLTLTDLAGNVRSEEFTLAVADSPQGEVRLVLTDLDGNPITQVQVNQEFLLHFYAADKRLPLLRDGVFAAYTDVLFDGTKVAPVTSTPIVYGERFDPAAGTGTFSDGLIDELGSYARVLEETDELESLVATVRMRAIGAGSVTFISDPADIYGNDFLLWGEQDATPPARITYGRAELTVGARFTANNDTYTVAQGSAATNFNVLANDQFASGVSGTLTIASLGTPSAGGTISIQNNQVRYQPAASFVGTETFTYTVTDGDGLTQTATVTVTVTSSSANAPNLVADNYTVSEDAAIATFNVLANDTPGSGGGTLRVTAVGTSANGSTVEIAPEGAGIRYRPAANFNGTETITYTVTDSNGGTASSTVMFTVTAVNDPPPAANITRDFFRGNSDTVVATLADYGTNVDGNETLTVSIVGTPTGGGSFRVDGTSIRYTPPSGTFTGTVTVQYRTTDPGGLSSTGTITLNVIDSLPTTFNLQLLQAGGSVAFGNSFVATLTGTTTGGQAVNRTVALSTTNSSVQFGDVAAGNYVVTVPALPFLTGMSQAQQISFTAEAAGGTVTESLQLGSLDPSHLRIGDFFRSAAKDKLFVVVQPGSDADAIVGSSSTELVKSPVVNLNSAGTVATVRGTDSSNAATQTTLTSESGRVQTRATENGYRLLRLNLTGATFAAPPAASSSNAEGESSSPIQAEGESSSPLAASAFSAPAPSVSNFGLPAAEGESSASETSSPADDVSPSLRRTARSMAQSATASEPAAQTTSAANASSTDETPARRTSRLSAAAVDDLFASF